VDRLPVGKINAWLQLLFRNHDSLSKKLIGF